MNERAKITPSHLSRQAIVYLRQSSAAQVENNRESTERQYALATKARELGWPEDRILVIDEDLGLSGSGSVARSGFARLKPKWRSHASVLCSASRCRGSLAITPIGTGSSILPA
jgi:Resolvase, N terminal domain